MLGVSSLQLEDRTEELDLRTPHALQSASAVGTLAPLSPHILSFTRESELVI